MAGLVVPYRGSNGKTRLAAAGNDRKRIALSMLADVVAACVAVGRTTVVTSDEQATALALGLGAEVAPDPGGGQGAAVAAVLTRLEGTILVVNSDLPAATPRDLLALLAAMPPGGMAIVEAEDGTTNAIALAAPHLFAPLYGPGSAERFRRHASRLGIPFVAADIPNIAADVDTPADLAAVTAP